MWLVSPTIWHYSASRSPSPILKNFSLTTLQKKTTTISTFNYLELIFGYLCQFKYRSRCIRGGAPISQLTCLSCRKISKLNKLSSTCIVEDPTSSMRSIDLSVVQPLFCKLINLQGVWVLTFSSQSKWKERKHWHCSLICLKCWYWKCFQTERSSKLSCGWLFSKSKLSSTTRES